MTSRLKDTLLLVGDANSDRADLHAIFEPHYYLLEAADARQAVLFWSKTARASLLYWRIFLLQMKPVCGPWSKPPIMAEKAASP